MKICIKYFFFIIITCIFSLNYLFAQTDTLHKKSDTANHKTFIGKMINNFKKDTTEVDRTNELKRNEEAFKKFDGLIIRNIIIKRVPFGISIGDTSKKFINRITSLANDLHHLTKTRIIKKSPSGLATRSAKDLLSTSRKATCTN